MKIAVFGASGAIGTIIANHLHHAGHDVIGTYNSNHLERPYSMYQFDCTIKMPNALPRDRQEDAIIWCIGVQGYIGPALDAPDILSNIITNLAGPAMHLHGLLARMKQARRWKIMFMAGGGAVKARPACAAYAAAKAGLVRFVETVAAELEAAGGAADINCIAPGIFDSRMTRDLLKAGKDVIGLNEFQKISDALDATLEERGNREKNLTNLIDFLISEKSDGKTGRLISAQWDSWWRAASGELVCHK